MRTIPLVTLIMAFLVGCGASEQESEVTIIPVPSDKKSVEPAVARLLQATGNDVHLAMDDPMKWMRHGSALFANSYYQEAASSFREAITINPQMPQATYLLATALWKENKQEEAIQYLQVALELIPDYDMGWRLLAEWQLERGETTRAEESARIAFELNSTRIGTRYILALSMMDSGRYDDALPILEEAMNNNTAPRWIYTLASQCYRHQGILDKSEQASENSGPPLADWPDPMFQHIPNLIMGKSELSRYALHLHEKSTPSKALPFLKKALIADPEHTNVRVALSMTLQEMGQLNQAEELLQGLIGEPNANYWKQYASVCISKSEWETAHEYIGYAIELDSNNANAHDIAALIASSQGDSLNAIEEWEMAAQLHEKERNWKHVELSLAYAAEKGELSLDGLRLLALSQVELEHIDEAKTTVHKLLTKNPNDEVALELQKRLHSE